MLKKGIDPFTLFETDDPSEYRWEKVDGGIRVIGYTGSKPFLRIPETIDGYAVVEIGDYGEDAFCTILPTILIPDTVCCFEPDAFREDYMYSSMWFGKLIVPEEHPFFRMENGILYSKDMKTLFFCFDREIQRLVMPDSVKTVKKGAFRYAKGLRFGNIGFSKNLKTIESFAFEKCESLSAGGKIDLPVLPEGTERLGIHSLGKGSRFPIPASVRVLDGIPAASFELQGDAFYTDSLNVVYTRDKKTVIGYSDAGPYYGTDSSIKTISFDENAEEIAPYAFAALERLEKLDLGPSVKRIGKMAFGSARIKTLRIPAQVEEIDDTSFGYDRCNSILVDKNNKHFRTDKNCLFRVNNDGTCRLMKCFKPIEEYVIPEGVVSIWERAFKGCESIGSLTLPSTLTEFDGKWIADTAIERIHIPKGVRNLKNIKGFKTVQYTIDEANPYLFIEDSVLYERDGETYRALDMIPDREDIRIREKTTEIADEAFCNLRGVKSVSLPDSVVRIGKKAFFGCGIREIVLPESVEVIDDYAFADCKLENVRLPDNLKYVCRSSFAETPVTSFETGMNTRYRTVDGALCSADVKTLLAVPFSKEEKTFAIPDTVEQVGQVFHGRRDISSVVLPDSLKTLVSRAMEDGPLCVSGGKGLVYVDDGCFGRYSWITEKLALDITSHPGSALTYFATDMRDRGNKEMKITVIGNEKYRDLSDLFEVEPDGAGVMIVTLKQSPNELTVPESIGGYKVTGLSAGALKDTAFDKLTFESPDAVSFEAIRKCKFKEFVLPEGISELPDSALNGCLSLEKVNVPQTVRRIGAYAFRSCRNLIEISLNEGLESIGEGAFWSCEKLESVSIPGNVKTIGKATFSYCHGLKTVAIQEGVESIGDAAFFGCKRIAVLSVPESVTFISDNLFADENGKYKDLYLNEDTLYSVVPGSYAEGFFKSYIPGDFHDGMIMKVASLGTGFESVEAEVFDSFNYAFLTDGSVQVDLKCSGGDGRTLEIPLTISGKRVSSVCFPTGYRALFRKIHFPESVSSVKTQKGTFPSYGDNIALRGIEVDENNPYFSTDGYSLYSKDLKRLIHCFSYDMERYIVPEGTEIVCEYAFESQRMLREVQLPKTVHTIEAGVFSCCGHLSTIYGADQCRDVAPDAFDGTPYLQNLPVTIIGTVFKGYREKGKTSYRIPEGITTIAAGAFYGDAASLEELTLPSTLKTIEEHAFSTDTHFKLKEMIIPEGVRSIPAWAFAGFRNMTRIELPSTLEEMPVNAFPMPSWNDPVVMLESINVAAGSPAFRSVDGVLFSADGTVLLRCPCAYPAAQYKIPEGVETIGRGAFAYCKDMKEVIFPDTLQSIGEDAFMESGLESANLKCREIGKKAFYCSGLTSVSLSGTETIGVEAFCGTKLENVILPDGLRSIGSSAFSTGYMKAAILPKSLKELGDSAFGKCQDITVYDSFPGQLGTIGGGRHPFFSCQVTVRSAETGEIKYVVWHTAGSTWGGSDTMKKCWKNGTDYDFALLDNSFKLIDGTENKLRAALTRLRYPAELSEAAKKNYTSYVSRNIGLALQKCTDEGDAAGIRFLSEAGLIKPAQLDAAIEYALSRQDSVEISALLMDLKNGVSGKKNKTKDTDFDLSDDIPSVWSFNKKGSTLLGRYKGNDTELVFPEEVNGVKVTGIAPTTSKVPDNYRNIVSVVIPEGYSSIGAYAFYDCENLEMVLLPSTLKEIGKNAFENCKKLKEIVIPDGIKTIDMGTFSRCSSLANVVFPKTLEKVFERAFYGCTALSEVEFPRKCTYLAKDCFADTGVKKAVFHTKKLKTTGNTFSVYNRAIRTVFYAYKGALKGCYNMGDWNTVTVRIADYPGDAAVSISIEDNCGKTAEESFFLEKTAETILKYTSFTLKASLEQAVRHSSFCDCLDSFWNGVLRLTENGKAAIDRLCAFCASDEIRKLTIREEKHCEDGTSVATMTWDTISRKIDLKETQEFAEDQPIHSDTQNRENFPKNTYGIYHDYFDYYGQDDSEKSSEKQDAGSPET